MLGIPLAASPDATASVTGGATAAATTASTRGARVASMSAALSPFGPPGCAVTATGPDAESDAGLAAACTAAGLAWTRGDPVVEVADPASRRPAIPARAIPAVSGRSVREASGKDIGEIQS